MSDYSMDSNEPMNGAQSLQASENAQIATTNGNPDADEKMDTSEDGMADMLRTEDGSACTIYFPPAQFSGQYPPPGPTVSLGSVSSPSTRLGGVIGSRWEYDPMTDLRATLPSIPEVPTLPRQSAPTLSHAPESSKAPESSHAPESSRVPALSRAQAAGQFAKEMMGQHTSTMGSHQVSRANRSRSNSAPGPDRGHIRRHRRGPVSSRWASGSYGHGRRYRDLDLPSKDQETLLSRSDNQQPMHREFRQYDDIESSVSVPSFGQPFQLPKPTRAAGVEPDWLRRMRDESDGKKTEGGEEKIAVEDPEDPLGLGLEKFRGPKKDDGAAGGDVPDLMN